MASYRVLEKSFINNALVEEGTIIEYEGEAHDNLELIEEPKATKGKAASQTADSLV